jgi:hypothetical protein
LSGLLGCAMLTASCASFRQISTAALPRVEVPEAARRTCRLHQLPPSPTLGDLEAGYVIRGSDLATCDLARQLAVDTLVDLQAGARR